MKNKFRALISIFALLMAVSYSSPEDPYYLPVIPGGKDNPSPTDEEGYVNGVKLKTTYRYYRDKSENFWYIKLDKPVSQLKNWKVVAKAAFPGSTETKVYECDHLTSSVKE